MTVAKTIGGLEELKKAMAIDVRTDSISEEVIATQQFGVLKAHNLDMTEAVYETTIGGETITFDFVCQKDILDPAVDAIINSFKVLSEQSQGSSGSSPKTK